jgi:excisionase family DNA binding protein
VNKPIMEGQLLLTKIQTAGMLGISVSTLEELIFSGQLKFKRVRRRVMIPRHEIEAYIKRP